MTHLEWLSLLLMAISASYLTGWMDGGGQEDQFTGVAGVVGFAGLVMAIVAITMRLH